MDDERGMKGEADGKVQAQDIPGTSGALGYSHSDGSRESFCQDITTEKRQWRLCQGLGTTDRRGQRGILLMRGPEKLSKRRRGNIKWATFQ